MEAYIQVVPSTVIHVLPVAVILWWLLCGLWARSTARRLELPEQPGVVTSALQGALWLRRVLIWSTVTLPPVLLSEPTAPAAEPQVIAPVEAPAVTAGSHSVGPEHEMKVVLAPEIVTQAGDVHDDHPPSKLPRRPVGGKVKAPCPVCEAKTKHGRDGVCAACGTPNRWLVARWGLDPVQAPERTIDPAPLQVFEVEPEIQDAHVVEVSTVMDEDAHHLGDEPTMAAAQPDHDSRVDLAHAPERCPACQRKSRWDRYGDCAFCAHPLVRVTQ